MQLLNVEIFWGRDNLSNFNLMLLYQDLCFGSSPSSHLCRDIDYAYVFMSFFFFLSVLPDKCPHTFYFIITILRPQDAVQAELQAESLDKLQPI